MSKHSKKEKTAPKAEYTIDIPSNPIRFVGYVCRHSKWLAAVATVAVIIAQFAEIYAVYAISRLVDEFNIATTKADQLEVLYFWGFVFIVLGVLDRIAWRISGFSGVALAIEANKRAYKDLFDYVTNHSHNYFINRFAGSISNKISNAASNSGDLIMRVLWEILPESISLFVTALLLANIHWSMGVVFSTILLFIFIFNVWWVQNRRPLVVAYAAASSRFRGVGVDLLSNIQATRQYARRDSELQFIGRVLEDKARKDYAQSYKGEWLMVINGVFGVLLMAVILWVVYVMLKNNLATAGQLVLVLLLLARVGYSFNIMGQLMNGFVRRYGEIEEGLEEVVVPHEILDKKNAKPLRVTESRVEWRKVNFNFDTNQVFDEFNLTIKSGERVGLVGPSGAGKTTFVSLLLRQHDIDSGVIEIDGHDISQVTQDSLREQIAVVPQEPLLFHRSIRENIAYGKPDATENEIMAVARQAQAHDFIRELPEGYDTLVGERGVKLSGGQKQRVAIARAMLKDAPILVLDEATSALDSESEVAIQKALHRLMEGKTVVAIAHRLSTLREMDRIIVLENGKIVEDGSHDALVEYGGVYARLWEHQAGGFLQE